MRQREKEYRNEKILLFCSIAGTYGFPCGCGNNTLPEEENIEKEDSDIYDAPIAQLEELEQIDCAISRTLTDAGYTVEHASAIQEILNTVGIESIEIDNMTGEAEDGLNSVTCYPNGYEDRDRRFFFTTEDGVLFYAGFSDEDLYDSESGGYLKNYSDVHIPEKDVTLEVYEELRTLATEEVKKCLNYPASANFNALDWGVGRSDDKYQIIGNVSAENGAGVEKEMAFSVWFVSEGDGFAVEGIALDGIRIK